MKQKPSYLKIALSFFLLFQVNAKQKDQNINVMITPYDSVLYKISGDIGFENWNFGFNIENSTQKLHKLKLNHYAKNKLVNTVEYFGKTLFHHLKQNDTKIIKSNGFHISLPKSASIDKLVLEFYSSENLIIKRTIPLAKFKQKNKYKFPLNGTWFISSGYDFGVEHRRHLSRGHFSYDIIKVNKNGLNTDGSTLKNNFSFGEDVFSPANGIVINIHDGETDGSPGVYTKKRNYIEIDHGNNEISRFVHLKNGSITVTVGEKVNVGQKIGEVGKSGTKTVHLHFGFQRVVYDSEGSKKTIPIPILFSDYIVSWNQGINSDVELGRFRRGQFIRNK